MMNRNQQCHYYDDVCYQLELNLQSVRRALIYLLDSEDIFARECFACNRLRCSCEDSYSIRSSIMRSSSISGTGFSFSDISSSGSASEIMSSSSDTRSSESEVPELDYIFITAPPADTLPMPVWQVTKSRERSFDYGGYLDLCQWIGIQPGQELKFELDESLNNPINNSWPPHPKSIWNYPGGIMSQPLSDHTSPPRIVTPPPRVQAPPAMYQAPPQRARTPPSENVEAFFRFFAEKKSQLSSEVSFY